MTDPADLLHANKHDPDCAFSCSYAAELFSFAVLSTAKEKDSFLCALCASAVKSFVTHCRICITEQTTVVAGMKVV